MSGLAKLCKMFGKVKCKDSTGKEVTWVWDSKQEKPVLKGKKRQPTIEYNMEKEGIGSTLKFSDFKKELASLFIYDDFDEDDFVHYMVDYKESGNTLKKYQ